MKRVGPKLLQLRLFSSFLLVATCDAVFGQSGSVNSQKQAIPGAVVTVRQNSHTISTASDQNGHYSLPPLGPGTWAVTVQMFGFETFTKDVDYSAAKGPVNF